MNKHFNSQPDPTKEWATTIGLSFVNDLGSFEYIKESKKLLPYQFCIKHHILPLGYEDGFILLAIADPYNLDILKEARFLLKKPIKEILCSKTLIQKAIETLYLTEANQKLEIGCELNSIDLHTNLNEINKEYDLLEESSNSSVISLLNRLFIEAIKNDASDIHFEPTDKNLIIKYRIDGILFEKHKLPKAVESQIITRLKVQAELDIAETRMPQDGRIKLKWVQKKWILE